MLSSYCDDVVQWCDVGRGGKSDWGVVVVLMLLVMVYSSYLRTHNRPLVMMDVAAICVDGWLGLAQLTDRDGWRGTEEMIMCNWSTRLLILRMRAIDFGCGDVAYYCSQEDGVAVVLDLVVVALLVVGLCFSGGGVLEL
ncbi:Hypothetical predicted protein [Olea europaea subsp. europaea]|uniref:Transmembrane protein n=1 Tax=Olea europaea subsp. europaea TaxID=158383 RepID=A0A8S0QMD0_OLEEU|nr:Hypothetical predicted protein [Olea europaea subsp. europaea]